MRILLDTHVFLWFITDDARLPMHWKPVIRDPATEVFLSVVSVWEAIVKHRLGKLPLPETPETYLPLQRQRHEIASLPLDEASVLALGSLPAAHRDPFDRMLVCQALAHGLTLATVDDIMRAYPVSRLTP
jgi:PIN domain nuclease of toxin-antitoxin system